MGGQIVGGLAVCLMVAAGKVRIKSVWASQRSAQVPPNVCEQQLMSNLVRVNALTLLLTSARFQPPLMIWVWATG